MPVSCAGAWADSTSAGLSAYRDGLSCAAACGAWGGRKAGRAGDTSTGGTAIAGDICTGGGAAYIDGCAFGPCPGGDCSGAEGAFGGAFCPLRWITDVK